MRLDKIRLLNEDETARTLATTTDTLREWRDKGEGPAYHEFGSSVRYQLGDLAEWIETCRVEPGDGGAK